MPDVIVVGAVADTDGRRWEVAADSGHIRLEGAGVRAFFTRGEFGYLANLGDVADDQAARQQREASGDPFGPEAYKRHRPGCTCWDCQAAQDDAR